MIHPHGPSFPTFLTLKGASSEKKIMSNVSSKYCIIFDPIQSYTKREKPKRKKDLNLFAGWHKNLPKR